jgi:hypothetical protein
VCVYRAVCGYVLWCAGCVCTERCVDMYCGVRGVCVQRGVWICTVVCWVCVYRAVCGYVLLCAGCVCTERCVHMYCGEQGVSVQSGVCMYCGVQGVSL